jgi:hypothetical protein
VGISSSDGAETWRHVSAPPRIDAPGMRGPDADWTTKRGVPSPGVAPALGRLAGTCVSSLGAAPFSGGQQFGVNWSQDLHQNLEGQQRQDNHLRGQRRGQITSPDEGKHSENLPWDEEQTVLIRMVLCILLPGGEHFMSGGGELSWISRDQDPSVLKEVAVSKRPRLMSNCGREIVGPGYMVMAGKARKQTRVRHEWVRKEMVHGSNRQGGV